MSRKVLAKPAFAKDIFSLHSRLYLTALKEWQCPMKRFGGSRNRIQDFSAMRPTALTSALDESNPLSLAYLVRRSLPDDQVGFIRGQISDLVALQLESFLQESEPRVDLRH